jgi:hypothetical protein
MRNSPYKPHTTDGHMRPQCVIIMEGVSMRRGKQEKSIESGEYGKGREYETFVVSIILQFPCYLLTDQDNSSLASSTLYLSYT